MPHGMTRTVFSLVLSLSAAGAVAAEPREAMRYHFTAGEKLAYVMEATTQIELSTAEGRSESVMKQLIDLTWEVGRVDADGKATITQTVERIRLHVETPDGPIDCDTRGDAAPADSKAKAFADRLNGMVGARLSATIDARGRLADIRFVGGAGRAGAPGDPSSEAGFRHLMGQLIPSLPETAPAPGQSWSVTVAEKLPQGKAVTETRCTSEGPEERGGRPLHKLVLAVTRKTETEAGEALGTSDGSGTAYLDPAAGRLMESALTHVLESEIVTGDRKLTRKVTESISLRLTDRAK
jgi:hypothetical protein